MFEAHISKGFYKRLGNTTQFTKAVIVAIFSDEIPNITPFTQKRYDADLSSGPNFYDPAASHVSLDGSFDRVEIIGSTWSSIDSIITDLRNELNNKVQAWRTNNDASSIPAEVIDDLTI